MGDSDREELAQGSGQAEAALASASAPELDDIFEEVARTLQLRRWEAREEPFRGFDSPPGKF